MSFLIPDSWKEVDWMLTCVTLELKCVCYRSRPMLCYCHVCVDCKNVYQHFQKIFFSSILTFFIRIGLNVLFSSVQFSGSVVSDSLRPHELQHARPPFPSQTPRVYSNSCLSIWWCHPAISSSVVPFSSCPQSLPASGSFPMSQLFA